MNSRSHREDGEKGEDGKKKAAVKNANSIKGRSAMHVVRRYWIDKRTMANKTVEG